MTHAVCCPRCGGLSRVGPDALGRTVECPRCRARFTANAVPPPQQIRPDFVPVVMPVPRGRPRDVDADSPDADPTVRTGHAGVVGLALVPLGIPLLWLIAPLVTNANPVFSFATPVALALGLVGLGLGVSAAAGWSPGTRVRVVLALVCVGYAAGGFLLFMKKEWAVAVRRHLPTTADRPWTKFPKQGGPYSVEMPGTPVETTASPLTGWALTGFRLAPGENARNEFLHVVYEVAHGPAPLPKAFERGDNPAWFALAKAALADTTGGRVTREEEFESKNAAGRKLAGMEFTVELPDGARHRVVRVIRDGDRAFYLAVEGAFLPDNLAEVRKFFKSFTAGTK